MNEKEAPVVVSLANHINRSLSSVPHVWSEAQYIDGHGWQVYIVDARSASGRTRVRVDDLRPSELAMTLADIKQQRECGEKANACEWALDEIATEAGEACAAIALAHGRTPAPLTTTEDAGAGDYEYLADRLGRVPSERERALFRSAFSVALARGER